MADDEWRRSRAATKRLHGCGTSFSDERPSTSMAAEQGPPMWSASMAADEWRSGGGAPGRSTTARRRSWLAGTEKDARPPWMQVASWGRTDRNEEEKTRYRERAEEKTGV
jgi:hypothetical protein